MTCVGVAPGGAVVGLGAGHHNEPFAVPVGYGGIGGAFRDGPEDVDGDTGEDAEGKASFYGVAGGETPGFQEEDEACTEDGFGGVNKGRRVKTVGHKEDDKSGNPEEKGPSEGSGGGLFVREVIAESGKHRVLP